MYIDTVSSLYIFIVHQNIFCIHRGKFVDSTFVNVILKLFVSAIVVVIVVFGVSDVYHSKEAFLSGFTTFLMVEHCLLIIGAWTSRASFDMLHSLDRFCGADERYYGRMESRACVATAVSCLLVCIDAVNVMHIPRITPGMAFCMWAAFSAHNSDLILYGLFIDGINLRLGRLEVAASPSRGAIMYRYIMNAFEHLNFYFYVRVFIIIIVIFLSTLIYLVIALLSDASMLNELIVIIMTRELISIGCLLYVCGAAAHSNTICDYIIFRLTKIYTLPSTFNHKKKNGPGDRVYKLMTYVNEMRPKFFAGQAIVLNFVTPIALLDASATYILVLIQFYIDYM